MVNSHNSNMHILQARERDRDQIIIRARRSLENKNPRGIGDNGNTFTESPAHYKKRIDSLLNKKINSRTTASRNPNNNDPRNGGTRRKSKKRRQSKRR